jgi:single-strand DNA-binding protein
MNKVFLKGRLGKDPELRVISADLQVCKFSLATSEKHNGVEKTQWHRITAWNKLADICNKYLKKGSEVIIVGKLEYSTFNNKDNQDVTITEIVAQELEFVSAKQDSQSPVSNKFNNELKKQAEVVEEDDLESEDLPF